MVLDAGALVAVDRADRRVIRLLELAQDIHVPAGALARVWRNPARLVRVMSSDGLVIHALDATSARAAGQLCAATATSDVVDTSVVPVARLVDGVTVTSDSDDLRRLDQGIDLVPC